MPENGNELSDAIAGLVADFFVASRDFNGIPLSQFLDAGVVAKEEISPAIANLLQSKRVFAMFGSHCENPHIVRIPPLPLDEQLLKLNSENPHHVCLYPTEEEVRARFDISQYEDRPFTKRLWLLEPHLDANYFALSVLERYFHDPRYHFDFEDNHGSISVREKYHSEGGLEEKDIAFLQTFGTGYDEHMNRVVLAYTRYLAGLSPEHQQHWHSHLFTEPCRPNGDYHKATLYGAWPKNVSVYTAFLGEQKTINALCEAIDRPPFFRKTFGEERPKGFHLMLLPTAARFDEFALLLDKMVSDNINKKFFEDDVALFDRIEHDDGTFERKPRGTLSLLEEWFSKYYKVQNEPDAIAKAMKPLRGLRKLRQSPAHSINDDEYNLKYAKDQDALISEVYYCIKFLRMIFMKHPKAQGVKIPRWMKDDNIVLY